MKRKSQVQVFYIDVHGDKLPVRLYHEVRNSARVSIGKKEIIMRLPNFISEKEQYEQVEKMTNWVKNTMSQKVHLKEQILGKNYSSGEILCVGERKYTLIIEDEPLKGHSARLKNGTILIKLAQLSGEEAKQKAIRTLLSRIVAKDYLPEITRRVNELNYLYFKKEVKSVSLKHNQSNWGSCSSKGNINLSTRLLFAPSDVVDYVIIHELAHLIELNHSDRFWKLVETAMPEFLEKEKWLKVNTGLCNF